MQDNQFEGIPSLGDNEGLQNYINQQNLNDMGLNGEQPSLLNPNDNQEQYQEPEQPNVGYTKEQIEQIIAENNAYKTQLQAMQQPQPQYPQYPQAGGQGGYSPKQVELIKQALDRGIPLERIQQALSQNKAQNQIVQKLNNLESYLAQMEYKNAQDAFVGKMQEFGTKFGLSENDLVTFANTALSKGINLINTPDVELIFRSIYPEQYAIRMQRINSAPTNIYGGGSIGQTPRESSKQVDAYVESFLKQRMPNQYNSFRK